MGGVAATIVPRTAVKAALDAQGLYTGPTGERLEAALGDWLDRAGYPRLVSQSGPEDLAFTGAAQPAGDVLWDLAQQAASRTQAGAYGGAAAVWPNGVAPIAAPPQRARRTMLSGLGGSLSFEAKAGIAIAAVFLGAALAGAGAGKLVSATESKKTEA